MSWWNFLREFLYTSVIKRPDEHEADAVLDRVALRHTSVDVLYLVLGVFTHFYGISLTLLFFSGAAESWPILVAALDAFQEPYLGGLGVYVVLKEIRKRYHKKQSQHYGEFFVAAWLILLGVSTSFVALLPSYGFDTVYKMIVTNSLATLIIYVGGLINRP